MNSLYTSSRIVQLKTIINDLGRKTRAYNVVSIAKRFNEQLQIAQEEYKSLTGEYISEWMPVKESGAPQNTELNTTLDKLIDVIDSLSHIDDKTSLAISADDIKEMKGYVEELRIKLKNKLDGKLIGF